MLSNQKVEVLIVGAGPTGLTLALIMQKLGIHYLLIDKKTGVSTTSKAIGLQARVSEVLYYLDVFNTFDLNATSDTYVIRFYNFTRCFFTMDLGNANDTIRKSAGKDSFIPQSLIIPQSQTEKILEQELNDLGGSVLWNSEFVGFENLSPNVNAFVKLPDDEQVSIQSNFIVSCDGAHSISRKLCGISFKGKTYPMRFLIIDVSVEWKLPSTQVHVWFHNKGTFSAIPLPGKIWRIFIEAEPGDSETVFTCESLQDLMVERTALSDAVIRDIYWQSDFRINSRMVSTFRSNNLFLAGDAAHIHSPTGGQGITTGMQDAYNLGWKLYRVLRHDAPSSLLDTYTQERLPIAKRVLKATEKNTKVFIGSNKFDRFLRDKLILPILKNKRFQRSLLMNLTQLTFHYRKSNISINHCGPFSRPKVRAGDRIPDIVFQRNSSLQPLHLFDLFKRIRPIVLIGLDSRTGDISEVMTSGEMLELRNELRSLGIDLYFIASHPVALAELNELVLIDIHHDMHRLFGVKGRFTYILRPDGYVGYYQDNISISQMRTYLQKLSAGHA